MKNIIEELRFTVRWFRNLDESTKGQLIVYLMIGIIVVSIFIDHARQPIEYIKEAEASSTPVEIPVEVRIDWSNKERVKQEIRKVFPENPETMIRIAICESGLVATATGPTNDHGVFQVHVPSHKAKLSGVDLNNPAENIRFARYLYDNGGLAHWRASRSCWNK